MLHNFFLYAWSLRYQYIKSTILHGHPTRLAVRPMDRRYTGRVSAGNGGWLKKRICRLKNRFPYISVIDEASNFKFRVQQGIAKAHHNIPLEEKVSAALR